MATPQRNHDQYFATLQGPSLLDELINRVSDYRNFYQNSGLAARWSLSLGNNYGMQPDGKLSWAVSMGGENGELVQFKVNDYASLVKHELVLAVKDRPAGIAKAVNSDPKTLRNARIGTQLVEYYLTDPAHSFEDDYVKALFLALLTAQSFVVQDWDTTLGDEAEVKEDEPTDEELSLMDPEGSGELLEVESEEIDENAAPPAPKMTGDMTQYVYPVWDSARDIGAPTSKLPWWIFSRFCNKWERAAQFPAYRTEFIEGGKNQALVGPFLSNEYGDKSDYIEEFLFIHLPSKACPKGRYVRFIGATIFLDVDFPYPFCNVHQVIDQELIGSSMGHTSNYDLLGMEQVTDALHSIILNNQSTFGMVTVIAPKGTGVTHQDLGKGLRFMEVDGQYVDKIKTLDLTRTAPEIFNYMEMLYTKKGTNSGINSIIQGDPQGALKGASGSAMALLQSQSLIFNSGVQKSFYRLLSSAGTGIIEMCRTYADEPRIVKIAGKANAQWIREFKYDATTLDSVSTVVFEAVNPVLQTAAGKLAVAQDLLKIPGMITSPKRYLEVLTTANLEAMIGDDTALQDAILEENEWLREGRPVKAIITENHADHIKGHQANTATPAAKEDPELVARNNAHIQEHIDMWMLLSEKNPALLMATGQQVLPVPQAMGLPAPGAPAPGPAGVANPESSAPQNEPSLPKPPTNPATGEDAPVAPGTSVRQAA